ncbi:hypothetical protein Tco_0506130 [Tanacetum coccineum]
MDGFWRLKLSTLGDLGFKTEAQLVDTDTESEPEVTPSEAKESHPLVSSDSTAPLLPDHPLTHASPTPTPTRVLFHHRTTRMAVRTQLTLSPGMSARIAEASALSPYSFRKRYRSSYETPSSSSSLTLPVRKSSDSNNEREGHGLDDKGQGLDDEAVSEPLGLGYGTARRHTLESTEDITPSTYEVGQSSRSRGWQVSPSSTVVPSPIASPLATPAVTISIDEDQFLERAALWHADLKRKLAEERRERLELTDHIARMERRQESGGV